MASITIYPLENYKIGMKEGKKQKDMAPLARLARLEAKYESEGLRRTVEGVLLIHEHGHPHVLLLQFGPNSFRLPGGRLRPGETEVEGLKRKLRTKMSPAHNPSEDPPWEIGQELATWWRPNFELHQYPYLPAHVTKPKESRKIFLVHLPKHCNFKIAKPYQIVAVKLFDLYAQDALKKYGPVVANIPLLLSRFSTSCEEPAPVEELEQPEAAEAA